MAGSFEILADGATVTGAVKLPTVVLPPLNGDLAYGDPVLLEIKNTGNTTLMNVSIGPESGDNNIVLTIKRDAKGTPGQRLSLSGSIEPGRSVVLWARGCYGAEEAEDAHEFELIVRALSMS